MSSSTSSSSNSKRSSKRRGSGRASVAACTHPSLSQINETLTSLDSNKDTWAAVSMKERIDYLRFMMEKCHQLAEDMSTAICVSKGLSPEDEDWKSNLADELGEVGYIPIRACKLAIIALQPAAAAESVGKPLALYTPPIKQVDKRYIADVFPISTAENILLTGCKGQVWIRPGEKPSQGSQLFRSHLAAKTKTRVNHDSNYDDAGPLLPSRSFGGTVSVVLGAGNTNAIGITDVIYKMFTENSVVLFKHNPVCEYMVPFFDKIFEPLIKRGFFAHITGGIPEGAHICSHPLVDTLHVTGSHHTHNIIRYGLPPDQAQRIARDLPVNSKRFTSELGCVTPCIVVPGVREWSQKEIDFQAAKYCSSLTRNCAFMCVSSKVLLISKHWKQKDQFIESIGRQLNQSTQYPLYYPGALDRYSKFTQEYKNSIKKFGEPRSNLPNCRPWTIIDHLKDESPTLALQEESFCPVSAILYVDAKTPAAMLEKSVQICENNIWGNLSCWMIIDPSTQRSIQKEFDAAIENLHYGSVGINIWTSMAFANMGTPWGAYWGNPYNSVMSGRGSVHNAFMFDNVEKGVVYGPWIFMSHVGGLHPPWFLNNKNKYATITNMIDYIAKDSFGSFLATIWQSLWG